MRWPSVSSPSITEVLVSLMWISTPRNRRFSPFVHGLSPTCAKNVHFAFPAADRLTVDVFHRVAVAAGYSDNGAPGERPEYHDGYYAAYVLDPDGHNVEAVFHDQH